MRKNYCFILTEVEYESTTILKVFGNFENFAEDYCRLYYEEVGEEEDYNYVNKLLQEAEEKFTKAQEASAEACARLHDRYVVQMKYLY